MRANHVCDFDQCARTHTHSCSYISCSREFSCNEDWCADMRHYMRLCSHCEPMVNAVTAWLGQYSFGEILAMWKAFTGEAHGALPIKKRCAPLERHRLLVQSFVWEFPNELLLAKEIIAKESTPEAIEAAAALERWGNAK